jgi:hypothetical protein
MASFACCGDGAVIKDNGLKIIHNMARVTFFVCRNMCRMFACGDNTVVAGATTSGNASMIVSSVWVGFDKARSIVTIITFHAGCGMLIGFTDCLYTIMTLTACAKNFQVIDEWNDV